MRRRRSRLYPVPHLFMAASVAFLAIATTAAAASAEVIEGTCTGTVTTNGELVVDTQCSGRS